MKIATQLSLFVVNQPGTLANICHELSKGKINIYALTVSDTTDHAVVRMVVSDTKKALDLFEQRGTLAIETDVIILENDNQPGSLGKIVEKLAKAKINIEYAYLATSPKSKKGLLVLRVNDTKKALKIISK